MTRVFSQRLIQDGLVVVNGVAVKPSYRLCESDQVVVDEGIDFDADGQVDLSDVCLDLFYEDEFVLVLYKPSFLLSHRGFETDRRACVVSYLLSCGYSLSCQGGDFRAGLVHRLDRETEGLMVLAKTDPAYFELVRGAPPPPTPIDSGRLTYAICYITQQI